MYYQLTTDGKINAQIRFADAQNILGFWDNDKKYIHEIFLPPNQLAWEDFSFRKGYRAEDLIGGKRYRITPRIIQRLIDEGANIHAWDEWIMFKAAETENYPVLRFLISKGADIHKWNDLVMIDAAKKGQLKLIKFLKKNSVNIRGRNDACFVMAAWHGHIKLVKFLAKCGADIHADYNSCFKRGSEEVVAYLHRIEKRETGKKMNQLNIV